MSFVKVWFVLFVLSACYVAAMLIGCQSALKPVPQPAQASVSDIKLPPLKPEFVAAIVSSVINELSGIEKASDIESFCPKWKSLAEAHKVEAFANLVAGIIKRESNFNPQSNMIEKSQGIDPVTGKKTVSEGLLQLSYKDARNWRSIPECVAISYVTKNIRDPFVNIRCGLRIMGRLIARDGLISGKILNSKGKLIYGGASAYWSVIRDGHHVDEIRAKVKALPFCKGV